LILGVILLTQSSIKNALSSEIETNYNAIVEEKDEDGVASISRLLTIQSDIKGINETFTQVPITSRLIDFLKDTNLPEPNNAFIERIVLTDGGSVGGSFTVSVTGTISSYAALDTYKASLRNAKFCSDQDRAKEDVKDCYELETKLKAKQKELPTLFTANGVQQLSSSYNLQRDQVSFRLDLVFNSGVDNPFAYFTVDKKGETVRMTGVKAIIESKKASDSAVNTPLFDKNAKPTVTEDEGGDGSE
jgi:hypothetical protein